MKTIEELVTEALIRLDRKTENPNNYVAVFKSEWFTKIDDLVLAIEDGQSWSDIKIPGRLKLEMKIMLNAIKQTEIANIEWVRCFSEEDNCYYFYNNITKCTEWEISMGTKYVDVDGSVQIKTNNNTQATEKSEIEQLESLKMDMNGSSSSNSGFETENNNKFRFANTTPIAPIPPLDTNIDKLFQYPPIPPLVERISNTPSAPALPESPSLHNFNHNLMDEAMFGAEMSASISPMPIITQSRNHAQTSVESKSDKNNRVPILQSSSSDDDSDDSSDSIQIDESQLGRLMEMGFDESLCIEALILHENDLPSAAAMLLQSSTTPKKNKKKTPTSSPKEATSNRGNNNSNNIEVTAISDDGSPVAKLVSDCPVIQAYPVAVADAESDDGNATVRRPHISTQKKSKGLGLLRFSGNR